MTDKLLCNWCISDKSKCQYCFSGSEYKRKVTNADRIRAMTDEELCAFLFQSRIDKLSDREWLDWLKQEASE